MKEFVHLHLHTEYSLLDGASKISDLVQKVKEFGMKSVAITDHGNLFGSIEFYKTCKENDIKPIIGVEAYLTEDMHKKEKSTNSNPDSLDKQYSHLVLLAKDIKGYKNLVKLVTKSYLEGFYYKPRIDKKLLEQHKEGLIILSGCIAGEIPQLILKGNYKEAQKVAEWYISNFGKEDFYIEIQRHELEEEKILNPNLIKIAKDMGLKIVATGDSHYLTKEDADIHDVLLCIQTGSKKSDEKRFRFSNNSFYLKSIHEIEKDFGEIPEAIKNTVEISEKCNLEIPFNNKELMPNYGQIDDADKVLREMVLDNLNKMFGGKIPEEYKERANYELEVIRNMGFSNYFLVVQDFVNWAKNNGIPVGPGRGSAAGALITYATGITQIDPIKYNLLFERFLNPERVTMPDIDVDVADRDRDKVIQYLVNKYGKDNTANIITFGTLQTKAAIRDVGRVLGIPQQKVDTIAKSLSDVDSISEAKTVVSEVREIYNNGTDIEKEWIETAEKLEGIVRHASIHASGIVISSVPIYEYIALYRDPKEGTISTQISAQYLEELGFLKMDILGLANLSVIQDTLKLIEETKGIQIDISSIPLDDKKTYQLLSSGETDGIFQVESDGMKEMLKNMKPSCIEDIIAALALYRPGPLGSGMDKQYINRKHGKEKVEYPHKDLEDILKETYGVILYQEQIMKIAQRICGFTLGQADNLRRAIGKKKKEIMEQMKNDFVRGAISNGYDENFAKELFDTIEKFAEYGFNKSHSAAYAIITYQTAYLKAHYPLEYMTALINSEVGKFEKMVHYVSEAIRMNIKILPPHINKSKKFFSIEETNNGLGIRYGFLGIKGFGESSADDILNDREKYGEYKSIEEFFERTSKFLKKNSYEPLIKAGALDPILEKRDKLISNLDKIISFFSSVSKDNELGQNNLFILKDPKTQTELRITSLFENGEIPKDTILNYEKEVLGVFLSHNPLKEYWKEIKNYTNFEADYIDILPEGCPFTVMGMITEIERKETIKGKIANIRISDYYSKKITLYLSVEATKTYENLLQQGKILLFKGVITKNTLGKSFPKVSKILGISEYGKDKVTELHIIISQDTSKDELDKIRNILKEKNGKCITYIGIVGNGGIKYFRTSPIYGVKPSSEVSIKLRTIKGVKSFWYY
ncbi:MAG: DNA polymerase III subunit alpha [Brevinematales bacterium]|nr:DNA polymerase III subunit alpha [Brevinematales bacterium]